MLVLFQTPFHRNGKMRTVAKLAAVTVMTKQKIVNYPTSKWSSNFFLQKNECLFDSDQEPVRKQRRCKITRFRAFAKQKNCTTCNCKLGDLFWYLYLSLCFVMLNYITSGLVLFCFAKNNIRILEDSRIFMLTLCDIYKMLKGL